MEETKAAGKTVLNGVDAFTLYDTYDSVGLDGIDSS